VPLIIRWPKGLAPRCSELLVSSLDLMPTLLGLMGLPVPHTCQGQNLASAIHQGNDHVVESVPLFFFQSDWRGLYTKRYTYSFNPPDAKAAKVMVTPNMPDGNALYDRQTDPLQMHNLFDSPEHRALRETLHEQSLIWMNRFGDKGTSICDIIPRVLVPEDAANCPTTKEISFGEKRLKGRPIDFL
jgi:arylsulfatase A-like enzyme